MRRAALVLASVAVAAFIVVLGHRYRLAHQDASGPPYALPIAEASESEAARLRDLLAVLQEIRDSPATRECDEISRRLCENSISDPAWSADDAGRVARECAPYLDRVLRIVDSGAWRAPAEWYRRGAEDPGGKAWISFVLRGLSLGRYGLMKAQWRLARGETEAAIDEIIETRRPARIFQRHGPYLVFYLVGHSYERMLWEAVIRDFSRWIAGAPGAALDRLEAALLEAAIRPAPFDEIAGQEFRFTLASFAKPFMPHAELDPSRLGEADPWERPPLTDTVLAIFFYDPHETRRAIEAWFSHQLDASRSPLHLARPGLEEVFARILHDSFSASNRWGKRQFAGWEGTTGSLMARDYTRAKAALLLLAIRAHRFARANDDRPPDRLDVLAGGDADLLTNPMDGGVWAYDPARRTISGEADTPAGTVTVAF